MAHGPDMEPHSFTPPDREAGISGVPMVTIPLRYFDMLCRSHYGGRTERDAHQEPEAPAATKKELHELVPGNVRLGDPDAMPGYRPVGRNAPKVTPASMVVPVEAPADVR